MADNNTQYKIDFNGKEMILNDSDLKSIQELLLAFVLKQENIKAVDIGDEAISNYNRAFINKRYI